MLICQLTDLHLRPEGVPAYRVVETNSLTERAFRAVAALNPRPDAVLITGDLTDCGLDSEYALLARLIRKHLPMPVYVIPGNHDRRAALRAGLADLPGVTSDPEFVQYAVDDLPVRLVMLIRWSRGGLWRAVRETALVPRPGACRAAGQADPNRDASPAIPMRHRSMDRINLRDAGALRGPDRPA